MLQSMPTVCFFLFWSGPPKVEVRHNVFSEMLRQEMKWSLSCPWKPVFQAYFDRGGVGAGETARAKTVGLFWELPQMIRAD